VAAEIIVVIEHKDARLRPGAAIEMGGREPADAAADHDQVVALLRLEPTGRVMDWRTRHRMRGLEAAGVLSPRARECRRIAGGLCRNLHRGRESGRNRQRQAIEEIAAGHLAHAQSSYARARLALFQIQV
jgi:hypothetical protein